MRPRIIIKGDEELGKFYVSSGILELSKLKDSMKFQSLSQDVRRTYFEDGTVISCQSLFGQDIVTIETPPEEPKEKKEVELVTGLIIVLRKLIDDKYDYWYWDVEIGMGFHVDPLVAVPLTPEIVTKWWTCEESEVVEYYTRVTPALEAAGGGYCGDSCGFMNFSEESCCNEPSAISDDVDTWDHCPCGGSYDPTGGPGGIPACVDTSTCAGGCGDFEEDVILLGRQSSRQRTNGQTIPCGLGYSWQVAISGLAEQMNIGPRTQYSYGSSYEEMYTMDDIVCGPYAHFQLICPSFSHENCICYVSPYEGGYQCLSSYGGCTGWITTNGEAYRWHPQVALGVYYGGCAVITKKSRGGSQAEKYVPLETIISSGVLETSFDGSWSEYNKGSATVGELIKRDGFESNPGTPCQPCVAQTLSTDSYTELTFNYAELSYGVGGWSTVITRDGRIAILIPELDASSSVVQNDGVVSGSTAGTTTLILRLVDADGEEDYRLEDVLKEYTETVLPNSRDDLGVHPNCNISRDLPLYPSLRGFHWLEPGVTNNVFVAYMFNSVFYAHLYRKNKKLMSWETKDLTDFIAWVGANSLEDYIMFLHERLEYEEEIYY